MSIKIIIGDVTHQEINNNNKIIVHCVNDIPVMGAGVALSLFKKWPAVRNEYMIWGRNLSNPKLELLSSTDKYISEFGNLQLGNVQFLKVEKNIYVANLVGQKDVSTQNICGIKIPPVRYEAIYEGLLKVKHKAKKINATVHAPLLGAGLAGGSLEKIYKIASNIFSDDIDLIFYAFSDKDYEELKSVHDGAKS